MFRVGDRVHFALPGTLGRLDGTLGTVVGFVTPEYAARLDVPDDVVVRWDSGVEFAHAPATLVHADRTPERPRDTRPLEDPADPERGTILVMSDAETNRQVVRDAFTAWEDGTGAISALFAADMVWRIEGHSVASREYRSAQQFVDEVLAPFGARFARGERFRPVRVRSILADGDTVAVIWDGHGVANDGRPYNNSYAWIMRLRDGQVIDGTAFYDSISFNELWDRVEPDESGEPPR